MHIQLSQTFHGFLDGFFKLLYASGGILLVLLIAGFISWKAIAWLIEFYKR